MTLNTKSDIDIGARHYTTGQDGWRVGIRHFWIRFRGLFLVLSPNVLLMGVPWWWHFLPNTGGLPDAISISVVPTMLACASSSIIVVVALFFYARFRAAKSIEIKACLHSLSHEMRDALCGLIERTNCPCDAEKIAHETALLFKSSNAIAEKVARYYGALIGDNSISVVIRLVTDFPFDGSEMTYFSVVGRAGALDPRRPERTAPIPSNEGLPKLLQSDEVNANGVVFIHDLKLAISHNIYKETPNDIDFPDDYNCLAVVPLNGWNGLKKTLIGILTIGGKIRNKLLRVEHIEILKAVGDRLAEFYSSVVAMLLKPGT